MKRLVSVISGLVLLTVVFLCGTAFADSRTLKVLAVLPLTGGAAEQGVWVREGLMLAVESMKSDSGPKVEIDFQDSQGDPKSAISAYQSAIGKTAPDAVISWGSGVGMALTPLVNRDKIVQMGVATATAAYRTAGDYTFRNFPSTEKEAEFASRVLRSSMNMEKIAVLRINNDYGLSTGNAFVDAFQRAGGRVAVDQSLEPHETDFRTIVTRLKQSNVSAVFLAAYPTEAAVVLKQMRAAGLAYPVVGSAACMGSRDFFSLAGEGSRNFFVVSSHADFLTKTGKVQKEFAALYRERFGVQPSLPQAYTVRAFDALRALVLASKGCAEISGTCLREHLFSMGSFDGAGSPVSFDEFGDIDASFTLFEAKEGTFVAR